MLTIACVARVTMTDCAEQRHADGMNVHREQRPPPVGRQLEIERQQRSLAVPEAVIDEALGKERVGRLVGEEVDREFVDVPQPRENVNQHPQAEQHPCQTGPPRLRRERCRHRNRWAKRRPLRTAGVAPLPRTRLSLAGAPPASRRWPESLHPFGFYRHVHRGTVGDV